MLNLKLPEQRRELYIEIALRRCRPGNRTTLNYNVVFANCTIALLVTTAIIAQKFPSSFT